MTAAPHIALFRGRGFVSRLIRWQTRSQYSHAAWIADWHEGGPVEVWEAWHRPLPRGGVRHLDRLEDGHDAGTEIHLYTVVDLTERQRQTVTAYIAGYEGDPYDWRGVLRFISRRRHADNGAWFCSEIIAQALLEAAAVQLLQTPPSHTQPGMLAWSMLTRYHSTITVGE